MNKKSTGFLGLRGALCLAMLACVFSAPSSFAVTATIQFYMTNAVGQPDTNLIRVFPVSPTVNADGSVTTIGPVIRIQPNSNGFAQTNLVAGNYLATNQFIVNQFRVPGGIAGSQGILFAVPSTTNTYTFGQLAISGYNTYNYTPGVRTITGTNGFVVTPLDGIGDVLIDGADFAPTYAQITNALGFFPLSPLQVTNVVTNSAVLTSNALYSLILLRQFGNTTLSNLATMGRTNFYLNSNPANYVDASVTNGLASTNYANTQTRSNLVAGSNVTFTTNGNTITIASANPGISTALITLDQITATNQTFNVGQGGTDFNLTRAGTNHVFNLPFSSATTTGKLSSSDWTNFNAKVSAAQLLSQSNAMLSAVATVGLNNTNFTKALGVVITNNFETNISYGSTSQFWRGDKTFQPYSLITNGLASTNYVQDATNALNLGTAAFLPRNTWQATNANLTQWQTYTTNQFLSTNTVYQFGSVVLTNFASLGTNFFYPRSNPSNFVTAVITNGLASTNYADTAVTRNLVPGSNVTFVTNANSITISASGGSGSGSGITILNGLNGTNQTFSVGTNALNFTITSTGTNHQFIIPQSDNAHTGLLSSNDFQSFNVKQSGSTVLSNFVTLGTNAFYPNGNPSNFVAQTIYATNNPSNIVVTIPSIAFWTNGAEWHCQTGSNWFQTIAP